MLVDIGNPHTEARRNNEVAGSMTLGLFTKGGDAMHVTASKCRRVGLAVGIVLWSLWSATKALAQDPAVRTLDAVDNRVITLTHSVAIGGDRRVAVRESFTLQSWLRSPRRAILFLNGTPTTGGFFNISIIA